MTCLNAFMPSFSSIKYDFRYCFCAYTLLGFRHVFGTRWRWQVIVWWNLCWMFNMYQTKQKKIVKHTNYVSGNRFQANDLKCLFANCASIRLHWLWVSFIVILSCTCCLWFSTITTPSFELSPFLILLHTLRLTKQSRSLTKTKIRKALAKPKLYRLNIQISEEL